MSYARDPYDTGEPVREEAERIARERIAGHPELAAMWTSPSLADVIEVQLYCAAAGRAHQGNV